MDETDTITLDEVDVLEDQVLPDGTELPPGVTAEVLVGGDAPQARKACEHRGPFVARPVFAIIGSNEDGSGPIRKWEVRLRVRCAACGVPFHPLRWTARDPSDNPIGVVMEMVPADGDVGGPPDEDPAPLQSDSTD